MPRANADVPCGRILLTAAACSVLALGAQAQNTNSVEVTGGILNEEQTTTGAAPAAAVVGTPFKFDLLAMPQGERFFGQADGLSNTLRGLVVQKDNGSSDEPRGRSVTNFVKVAGGAAPGTPMKAKFDFQIDGRIGAGALDALTGSAGLAVPAGQGYTSLAAASLRLKVVDLDNPASSPLNADLDFRYDTRLELWMQPGAPTPSGDPFVMTAENASAFTHAGAWSWSGNTGTVTTTLPAPEYVFQSVLIPTRSFSFEVDTAVGHRLNLLVELVVDAFGTTEGSTMHVAYADFGRTFDAELSSSLPGVTFSNDLPGVGALPAVPEPGALTLWLLGLAALAWRKTPGRALPLDA